MKTIHVYSLDGIDYKPRQIVGIGDDVYEMLPLKYNAGFLVKFVDKDGNESDVFRVRKVEPPKNERSR